MHGLLVFTKLNCCSVILRQKLNPISSRMISVAHIDISLFCFCADGFDNECEFHLDIVLRGLGTP